MPEQPIRVLSQEEFYAGCLARGLMTEEDIAEAREESAPDPPLRFRGFLATPWGRDELVYLGCSRHSAADYVREAIVAGYGRIGYVTKDGRLLYHVGRSPSLRLLP